MKFKRKSRVLTVLLALVVGMSAIGYNNDRLYEIAKNIEIFVNVYKELNANYVDDIDPNQLMRTGIDAMVGSLDPYTNFISESQVASYRINTEGKYDGIGAVTRLIDGKITIVEPMEGSPSDIAGLKAGDVVLEVDGQATKGKTIKDLNTIVRGIPGTDVKFKIDRDGAISSKTLTRGSINIKNVPYYGMIDDEIGYVALTTFTQKASRNIGSAIKDLKRDHELKGVVLDLRNNGGGLLGEAIQICNLFVPQGIEVVSTKSKVKERDQHFKTTGSPLDLDIPLAVMINKSSASASEIVSGVIQDLDRGVIIGQRSFGKGLVQNHKEVGYNNRIKVTTSKYYIPSGRCIQGMEYEDGSPVDIPDNERSTFYTKNKRPVLDGGGVTPDLKLDEPKIPLVVKAMLDKHMIFKYVNGWVMGKDSIEEVGTFEFKDFEEFKAYLTKNDFVADSEIQEQISKLEEMASDEKLGISNDISALRAKLEMQFKSDITTHKGLIVDLIETEIATRYYYQTGKVKQRLDNDSEITEAISLLKDTKRYTEILKK